MRNSEGVTERCIEEFFNAGMPKDNNGKTMELSKSSLYRLHGFKPMNARRIQDILAGSLEADRVDLINLSFFIASQETGKTPGAENGKAFIESTNRILNDCFMGEMSYANPYDAFLIMCMHTKNPMNTYAEVWKKSFADEDV